MSVEQRFWAKVQKTDSCWLWTGGIRQDDGYGKFWCNGKPVRAHRMAWALTFGAPAESDCVLHRCDVRHCVRPEHLFKGDRLDNRQDCVVKRRHAFGDNNGQSKLDVGAVRAIRERAGNGEHGRAIARSLSLSESAVRHIIKRRNWAHVP